jgi:hypothetical protein
VEGTAVHIRSLKEQNKNQKDFKPKKAESENKSHNMIAEQLQLQLLVK